MDLAVLAEPSEELLGLRKVASPLCRESSARTDPTSMNPRRSICRPRSGYVEATRC